MQRQSLAVQPARRVRAGPRLSSEAEPYPTKVEACRRHLVLIQARSVRMRRPLIVCGTASGEIASRSPPGDLPPPRGGWSGPAGQRAPYGHPPRHSALGRTRLPAGERRCLSAATARSARRDRGRTSDQRAKPLLFSAISASRSATMRLTVPSGYSPSPCCSPPGTPVSTSIPSSIVAMG